MDTQLLITGLLHITTENSVWLIDGDGYQRLPREERSRRADVSIDGALDDVTWHEHDGVWLRAEDDGHRLRILPAGRSAGSGGIVTGPIVRASVQGVVTADDRDARGATDVRSS